MLLAIGPAKTSRITGLIVTIYPRIDGGAPTSSGGCYTGKRLLVLEMAYFEAMGGYCCVWLSSGIYPPVTVAYCPFIASPSYQSSSFFLSKEERSLFWPIKARGGAY
jgi:hypothetical protein